MKAVILCGGKGTRMLHLTKDMPKALLPVGGVPILEIQMRKLMQKGIREFVLCTGYMHDGIEKHFNTVKLDCKIDFSVEHDALGTGGALFNAKHYLNSNFLCMNGDIWLNFSIASFIAVKAPCILLTKVKDFERYGSVVFDGAKITEFLEKTRQGSGIINAGIYHLDFDVFRYLTEKCSLEKDVFPILAKQGKLNGYLCQEKFFDIGTYDDYNKLKDVII